MLVLHIMIIAGLVKANLLYEKTLFIAIAYSLLRFAFVFLATSRLDLSLAVGLIIGLVSYIYFRALLREYSNNIIWWVIFILGLVVIPYI